MRYNDYRNKEREEKTMVEMIGMMMYESDFEETRARALEEWEEMSDDDREVYDDYEEFEYLFFHRHLYSDD